MSDGWLQVSVPPDLAQVAAWGVWVGTVQGGIGKPFVTPAGRHPLTVTAGVVHPDVWIHARLDLEVPVMPDRLTTIDLPFSKPLIEVMLRALLIDAYASVEEADPPHNPVCRRE